MSSEEEICDSSDSPNGDIFHQKRKPKIIRVLTVMAYVLSVSMAAILLSVYYIFMWNANPHLGAISSRHAALPQSLKQDINNSNRYVQLNNSKMIQEPIRDRVEEPLLKSNNYIILPFNRKADIINDTTSQPIKVGMSYKSNGVKLTKCDSQQWKTASMLEPPSVKFAGEEAKDRLYEPKHKKKLVRVLTVVAYVFFVSLAAIMLSLYYVFLWNGDQKVTAKLIGGSQPNSDSKCKKILAEIQRQIRLMDGQQHLLPITSPSPSSTTVESTSWYDEDFGNFEDLQRNSNFFKKLLNEYPYNDTD